MLWKKESSQKDALYVDFFLLKGHAALNRFYSAIESHYEDSTCEKSDEKSEKKRNEGNKLFQEREWAAAMEKYNESLSYAKHGSKNISLAFANRSACFFNMKRYNECLIDIGLAVEAGYPEDLMPKLDKRRADSLKRIESGAQLIDDFGLKMDFAADEKFPCMANVLNIKQGGDGDFSVFAKTDIDVGQTIAVEKAFTTCLYTRFGWRCNLCLKQNTNLIACDKCTVAMFCHDGCQSSPLHGYECGLKFAGHNQMLGALMNEIRTIIKVVNMFANIDELMDFVEQAITTDPNELPHALLDEKSKYRAFLKLPYLQSCAQQDEFIPIVFCIYKTLIGMPKINALFKLQKHSRFLMHLIAHHNQVANNNSIRIRSSIQLNERREMCCHAGLIKHFFKHSCAPNVLWTDRDGHSVIITIRPVSKGQELTMFYFDILMEPKLNRQKILWENKQFVCNCTRCDGNTASRTQRKRITSDSNYQKIVSKSGRDDSQTMMDKCEMFLRTYNQIPWCDEIGRVVCAYISIIRTRLIGSVTSDTIFQNYLLNKTTEAFIAFLRTYDNNSWQKEIAIQINTHMDHLRKRSTGCSLYTMPSMMAK
ncbi:SET and MYND domain-containing protein 4-like [Sitodiplosis mosellana]|uniref:SET and MYND domain-containing protein 4-like n=1 Tax=Sitodiplosis mosellana TaxID=263140 RepID=UPI002444FB8D|nr:SET and MYND domain-containing protein 4-like [Sitodiplosis mosellana]